MTPLRVVVLCGGKGTRLEGLDLPKPLCTIRGKPMLFHVLDALPPEIQEIDVFYSAHLDRVQFQKHVIHSCPRTLRFVRLTADTRGPVETAYICLKKAQFSPSDSVLFLDNDSINEFAVSDIRRETMSLGVFTTTQVYSPYSFVEIVNDRVVKIREKERISDLYCTGAYYYPSVQQFLDIAERLFAVPRKEYFMSDTYRHVIESGGDVAVFHCRNNIPLGTLQDIHMNIDRVKSYPLRICFDIDNTILTNSSVRGSRDGIEAIPEMVAMIRKLHSEGHTIVLSTARSMQTCNSNTGAANKRGALDVLTRLEEYNVPYDEIYFGKPWAHVYVDDRAWNQYTNPTFARTFFGYVPPLVRSCSNNQNTLVRFENRILKKGTNLEGEIYFYKTVSHPLFPTYHESTASSLTIQYVEGQTVSQLFRNRLLRKETFETIIRSLRTLHAEPSHDDVLPTPDNVYDNLMGNLETHCRRNPAVYDSLPGIQAVLDTLRRVLRDYVLSSEMKIVNVVHGDPWFENLMLTSSDTLCMIDMRGKVGPLLTVKGDPYLDYAKVYQSVLGFDYAIYGEDYDPEYEATLGGWMRDLGVPIESQALQAIVACCILKSFFYFSDASKIRTTYALLAKLPLMRGSFAHHSGA
jgi:capsule biosynthesis phosphatase